MFDSPAEDYESKMGMQWVGESLPPGDSNDSKTPHKCPLPSHTCHSPVFGTRIELSKQFSSSNS